MVTTDCGVKVPVRSPRLAIDDFAQAIERLANAGTALLELSRGTTQRAEYFLWERNGDRVNAMYREIFTAKTRGGERLAA